MGGTSGSGGTIGTGGAGGSGGATDTGGGDAGRQTPLTLSRMLPWVEREAVRAQAAIQARAEV